MKLSLNWLNRYVDLRAENPENISDLITKRIAEIEQTETVGLPASVVVGEVLRVEKHPDADRLRVAEVGVGTEKLQIVCGAPNLAAGQKIPVALVGTDLGGGFVIKKARLRGVESCGMICAEDELGLGTDHEGIMVLDKNAPVSKSLRDFLKITSDAVFEVENKNITHRPDLFSHRGFARELSVVFDQKLKLPKPAKLVAGKEKLNVKISAPENVRAYYAVRIDGVKIDKAPAWLQSDLRAIGEKSINNIVDATNWCMNDSGQPFHAFDADKISGLEVRLARAGEELLTLDQEQKKLEETDLVIADAKRPLALAGIIGGTDSSVSESTTAIILEAANFDPVTVRRTSKRLGVRTAALTRFEKALDPALARPALAELVQLILQLCPEARVTSEIFTYENFGNNLDTILNNYQKKFSSNFETYLFSGDFYFDNYKFYNSISAYRSALDLDITNFETYSKLFNLYSRFGFYKELDSLTNFATDLFPAQPLVYLFKAIAGLALGSYDDAYESLVFGNSLVFDQPELSAYFSFYLSQYFRLTKDNSNENLYYNNALSYASQNCDLLAYFAFYFAKNEIYKEKSFNLIGECIISDIKSLSPYISYVYSFILYKFKDYDAALTYINSAIENSKHQNFVYYELLGNIYFKNNNIQKSEEFWLKSINIGNIYLNKEL